MNSVFSVAKTEFNSYLQKNNSYSRERDDYNTFNEKKKGNIRKIFNNEELSIHVLPSFPFEDTKYNMSGIISFKTAFCIKEKNDVEKRGQILSLMRPTFINCASVLWRFSGNMAFLQFLKA